MKTTSLVALGLLASLGASAQSKVSKKLFQDIGDKVVELHQGVADKKGWYLDVQADWDVKSEEANVVTRNAPFYSIYYSGGLIKSGLSPDGLALVLCHEAGHLFGKRMKGDSRPLDQAPEAEADYYSTSSCLKNLWLKYPELKADTILEADKKILSARFKNNLLSIRAGAASLQALRALKNKSLKANATDSSKVKATETSYPSIPCRLDTYYAGIENKPRPSCWFNGW